jgi:WD40 repeat protein
LVRLAALLLLPCLMTGAYLIAPPTPRVSLTLPGEERVVAVSPDGNTLATSDGLTEEFDARPGTLRLWDLRTGRPGPSLEGGDGLADFARFSPDSQVLCGVAAAAGGLTHMTWSVADGRRLGQLAPDPTGPERHFRLFSSDSRFALLERSRDRPSQPEQIEFWDTGLREARATIPGNLQHSQWSAHGRRLATYLHADGGRIERAALHELAAEDLAVRPVAEHAVSAEGIAFSADLDAFATVDWPAGREAEASLTLRDMSSGAVLADGLPGVASWRMRRLELDRERRRLRILWVDPDPDPFQARYRITSTEYDLDSRGATRHEWYTGVTGEFSPDYRWFAEQDDVVRGGVELWDTAGGEDRGRLRHDGDLSWDGRGPVSFTNDSRLLLVVGLRQNKVAGVSVDFRQARGGPVRLTHRSAVVGRLWDLEARREVCAFDGCARAHFLNDSHTLVALGMDPHEVMVWDVPARKSWGTSLVLGLAVWAILLGVWWAWRWYLSASRWRKALR